MTARYHVVADPAKVGAPQAATDFPDFRRGSHKQRLAAARIRAEYVKGVNLALMREMGYTDDGETSIMRAFGELMPKWEAMIIAKAVDAFVSGPGSDANLWLDHFKKRPDLEGRIVVTKLHRKIASRVNKS